MWLFWLGVAVLMDARAQTSGTRDLGPVAVATEGGAAAACGYRAVLFAAQDYQHPRIPDLETPHTDVQRLGEILERKYGFQVETHLDPTRKEILDTLHRLDGEVRPCEGVVLYYAGHGKDDPDPNVERGFWLPVDAAPDSRSQWITTADVAESVRALDALHVLLVADSCFSGTLFRDVRTPTRAPLDKRALRRSRWVITSGGNEPVVDRYREGMSVFAYFLWLALSSAEEPSLSPDGLFPQVRNLVEANADQVPQQGMLREAGHEGGQLVLVNLDAREPLARPPAPTPAPPLAPVAASPPPRPESEITTKTGLVLVWVDPRTFVMGSPPDDRGRNDDEAPHEVTVAGFYVTRSEITQAQWTRVMGSNPSHFQKCGGRCPVEQVSWLDAVVFANAVSEQEGRTPAYTVGNTVAWNPSADGYRLLTEAEWERVARADPSHRFAGSRRRASAVGWVSGSRPREVCSKPENALGLCDLTGNVWEWVWDWYGPYASGTQQDPRGPDSGTTRAMRGGAWNSAPVVARVTARNWGAPDYRDRTVGLRLARSR